MQGSNGSSTLRRIPAGICVNRKGHVWLCEALGGTKATPTPAETRQLGKVHIGSNGSMNPDDVDDLLSKSGVMPMNVCIATPLTSYSAVSFAKKHFLRWMSTTTALAIDYCIRDLKSTGKDSRFFILHQEGRLYSLGVFDYADKVLEVLDNCSAFVESFETPATTLVDLFERSMYLFRTNETYPLLCLASDQNITTTVNAALVKLRDRHKSNSSDISGTLTLKRRHHSNAACGVALLAQFLSDGRYNLLVLDVCPFEISLIFGDHRIPMIWEQTTIPTTRTIPITLREGEQLQLELSAFDEYGLKQRFPLAFDATKLNAFAAKSSTFDVTVDIDTNMVITVGLSTGEWHQRVRVDGRSPLARGALTSYSGGRTTAHEPLSGTLDELIATLDDVDLGVRALSQRDLQKPAGAALLTVRDRLLQAISKLGVEYYQALGKRFDPHLHEAMDCVIDPTLPDNLVVDELRRGFRRDGRVIRHSLVRVANPR